MVSRKLWRVLNDPPTLHPLFWRTIYRSGATQFATRNYKLEVYAEKVSMVYFVVLFSLWILANIAEYRSQSIFLSLLLFLFSLPMLLFVGAVLRYSLFNGMVNGLFWALRISNGVAYEREQGRLELLWLSPPGALGATIAVCTGCLYRQDTFHQFRLQCKIIIWIALALGALLVVNVSTAYATPYTSYQALAFVNILTLIAAIYLDSIQAPILGSLIGMLVPTFTENRLDTRVWTVSIYLLLQIVSIVFALLIGTVILPMFYLQLNLAGWLADISPPLVSLISLYWFREGVISIVWYALTRQLNADPREMRFWP
jgi:hypothetical protein